MGFLCETAGLTGEVTTPAEETAGISGIRSSYGFIVLFEDPSAEHPGDQGIEPGTLRVPDDPL